jgi:putative transcriptional regulator
VNDRSRRHLLALMALGGMVGDGLWRPAMAAQPAVAPPPDAPPTGPTGSSTSPAPTSTPRESRRQAETRAAFLIATPRLSDARYRRTVILTIPRAGERHVGLVVNRPTTRTLGNLFPDQPPSQKVTDPVYAGGPMAEDTLFALVRATQQPDARSLEMLPGLYFVQGAATLDRIIDERPNSARYFAGLVLWRSGELRSELRRGLWRVTSADIDGVFQRDAERLWRERLEQAERTNA